MLRKLFSGIFGHFLLRLVFISILTGLLLLAFVFKYFDVTTNSFAAEQGNTVINTTLAATGEHVFSEDYTAVVDHALTVLNATPNIISIIYSKRNGDELVISNKQWGLTSKTLPYYKMEFQNAFTIASNDKRRLLYQGYNLGFSDNFSYSKPVYISGKDWGVLTIVFSTATYSSSIKFFYEGVMLFLFASVLISFFLFWLSSKRIRQQINSFSAVAKTLAEGNLNVQAQEMAIGEIGSLGKAINHMASSLAEKSARLFQLAQIVEQTDDLFILFNGSFEVIFVNHSAIQLTGHSASTFMGMSMTVLSSLLNLTSHELQREFMSMLSSEQHAQTKYAVLIRNNHALVDVEIRLEIIFNTNDKDTYFLIVLNDISARKRVETELRIAATAFEVKEGMMVIDIHRVMLRVNHAFTTITGYSAEDAIGQSPQLMSSGEHDASFYSDIWRTINNLDVWEGEVLNRRKNGEVYYGHLTITAVKDNQSIITNYVATLSDITLRKAAEEEIQRLAFYDPLTRLPNRRLLLDRLKQAITSSARTGRGGAILFLDLDHFKTLNDTLGHAIGDLLLQQVALRLESCVRKGDTVARLGGDEFVVLLENLGELQIEVAAKTEDIGEKILTILNQPYQLATHEYQSTPSIGAALIDNHSISPDELLKQADIAMYQAKKAGRNTLCFFDPQMQENINIRVDTERELNTALEQQQFYLYYQLQVNNLGHPLGAEALIRWLHPTRGLISPLHFIPLAEETGLIVQIGDWVLNTACKQLKLWEQDPATRHLTLSINVSVKQFRQIDFVTKVKTAVQRFGIKPQKLKLELTESMLLDNVDDTILIMNALKEAGIFFSLDDFGTGYSSLQYLKKLPIYELKIDQMFVQDIATDSSDQVIVCTIIAMAHSLAINVIAEGVETPEQRQYLLENGCTNYQGYLFSKPVPIDAFVVLLRKAEQHIKALN